MAEKNTKHVPRQSADDRRAITATFSLDMSCPFSLPYIKTKRLLPATTFAQDYFIEFKQSTLD